MSSQFPSISKLERTQRIIAWVIPPILLFIALTLALTNQNRLTILKRTKQDQLTAQQTAKDSEQFSRYVTDHPKELQLIEVSVPNEQMMVSLLEDIETTIRTIDPQGQVSFSGSQPVRSGVDLIIPVVIKLSAPLDELPDTLRLIRKLPYLMQLTSVVSSQTEKGGEHVLGYKLFVQEPFTGF